MRSNESVLSNWAVLIDEFNTSGQEFFAAIERNVQAREVPEVSFTRVTFRESGLLSSKREYLRVRRGNLNFDVGAAPYGTGFFFSWWLVQSRTRFSWFYTLGYFVALGVLWALLGKALGGFFGGIAALVVTTFLLGFIGKRGLIGPEEYIAQAPLIGLVYRLLFNPDTYYSQDIAAAFQESIRRAVNDAVDEALKGGEKDVLSEAQKQFKSSLGVAQALLSSLK